jgi:hypothetical protein
MDAKPPGIRWLIAVVFWFAAALMAWQETQAPTPARDWRLDDLLNQRGWVEPMGFNTARGRSVMVNPKDGRAAVLGHGTYVLLPPLWLIFANLASLIYFARVASQQVRYRWSKQPLRGAIRDAPLEDLQDDRLQRAPLVRTLAQLFRNQNTRPPLAVALTAPWGVGKSSVLRMLQKELQGHARCVYINPWHYPQDSQLLAALMTGICTEAVPPTLSFANLVFRFSLFLQRVVEPHWRGFLAVAGILFFAWWSTTAIWLEGLLDLLRHDVRWQTALTSLAQTGTNMRDILPRSLQAWVSDGASATLMLLGVFVVGRKVRRNLYTFSPSLTQALAQSAKWAARSMSLPDWTQHAGLRYQFAKDFREIAQAFGTQRLVLLIDDLDRCEPHQVAQTLATLNFVFSNEARCFVVLAMDDHYVEHAIGQAYKDMAIAVRDGQPVSSAGAAQGQEFDDNAACLKFARHYLSKLVQLQVKLTHDKAQGALMVLDALPDEDTDTKDKKVEGDAPLQPSADIGRWLKASVKYHTPLLWLGFTHTVSTLGWKKFQTWRRLLCRQSVLKLCAFIGVVVCTVGRALWWLIRRIFNAVLDSRLRHWELVGNGFLVAFGSYVLALLLVAMTATLVPALVPTTVRDTTIAVMEQVGQPSQSAVGSNAPGGLDTPSQTASPKSSNRENSDGKNVLPPDTNAVVWWWPLIHVTAFFIFFLWTIIRAAKTVRDSEGFLLAVRHWHGVLSPRLHNPREWKRLSNMARFLAMRVRADQYTTRSQRLASWWQSQLAWARVVLNDTQGKPLPSPEGLGKTEAFTLSEGAVVELWMLSLLSKGCFHLAVRAAIDANDPLASTPMVFLFAACRASDPTEAEKLYDLKTSIQVIVQSEKEIDYDKDIEHGLYYELFKFAERIEASPNLQPLFQIWESNPQAVAYALRQWLAWTQDLHMDVPAEDKSV